MGWRWPPPVGKSWLYTSLPSSVVSESGWKLEIGQRENVDTTEISKCYTSRLVLFLVFVFPESQLFTIYQHATACNAVCCLEAYLNAGARPASGRSERVGRKKYGPAACFSILLLINLHCEILLQMCLFKIDSQKGKKHTSS